MSWKRTLAAGLALLLIAFVAGEVALRGQGPAGENDAEVRLLDERVKAFLGGLFEVEDAVEKSFEELLKDGPLRAKSEKKDQLIAKTKDLQRNPVFGRIRGGKNDIERVDAKQVGQDLVVMKYLYKYEYSPVAWYFTFYRTGGAADAKWVVISVRFDTDLELLAL